MSKQGSIGQHIIRVLAYGLAAAALGGCALGRDTVAVTAPSAGNPATGQAVRIESVLDARKFEVAPSSPDIPSLDDAEASGDAIKARAIGRKRNTYGKALGDIVLPEGQTVAGLTETAIATAFRESGYVVASKGDANYDSAVPVSARVNEFWAWVRPGFWSVTTNQKAEVELQGNVGGLSGKQVLKTQVTESKQVVTGDDWRQIVEKGLKALTDETKLVLGRGGK